MPKKKSHRKFYQILVIPDDKDEPKTFSISVKSVKFVKIIAIILATHLVVGIGAYVFGYTYFMKTQKLQNVNEQLEANNNRIDRLLNDFTDLENSQTKIRQALGLSTVDGSRSTTLLPRDEEQIIPNILPIYESRVEQTSQIGIRPIDKLDLLRRSKSTIHNFEKSVPTFLPVEGVLTTDYENMKYTGPNQHRGIDIAAQRGSMVRSAADGVVVFSGWTYDLGNMMIIYHGNGFYTYYGHNQRCLFNRGSLVKKGDPIALLGNSGISSAPHLHFEIWKDGVPLDPKDFILAFTEL